MARRQNPHGSLPAAKTVARELRKQGLTPVYVGAAAQKRASRVQAAVVRRRQAPRRLFFTQELSTLLNAGVPLDRALTITAELTERATFRTIVLDVLRVLKGGRSLADSLATHPEYFSDLYINMVRAGEASGALAVIFERLAEFERTRDELRNYIISSMIYPALLAHGGRGVDLHSAGFRGAAVRRRSFDGPHEDAHAHAHDAGGQRPGAAPTAGSRWCRGGRSPWAGASTPAPPPGGCGGTGRRLKMPLLGDALLKAETSRFARAMATLVANSVPLVQSLGIAAATLNNRRIANALEGVAQGVKRGEGIAVPLRRAAVFPPLAAHLLTVGEETGQLDPMFARMADIYENDTRAAIRRFTAIFEPMVILVMGIMVGSLILSMLLAMTSINDVAM